MQPLSFMRGGHHAIEWQGRLWIQIYIARLAVSRKGPAHEPGLVADPADAYNATCRRRPGQSLVKYPQTVDRVEGTSLAGLGLLTQTETITLCVGVSVCDA